MELGRAVFVTELAAVCSNAQLAAVAGSAAALIVERQCHWSGAHAVRRRAS